jgi:ABC-type polysaccharide/polyol phosphate transport system ATPase subunit
MKMDKNNYTINLTGISKRYTIHHEKPTLMETLINRKGEKFWALRNIHLKIMKGEKVGIIGSNGSGKTTVLKIITGITTPTRGSVRKSGKLASLIDLEAGFHPELTGIQNIYLNGMILGMSRGEVESKIDRIISFADIGKFIDVPLFTYSEGMKLRLGYSIAINTEPDILILDENLYVGDSNFIKKTYRYLIDFSNKGNTIVMVSHDLNFIKKSCNRAIFLERGRIIYDGDTYDVLRKYKKRYK